MQEAWNILPEGEEAWRVRFTDPSGRDPLFAGYEVFLSRDPYSDGVDLYNDWSEWDSLDDIERALEELHASYASESHGSSIQAYGWIIERYANDGTGAWEEVESSA